MYRNFFKYIVGLPAWVLAGFVLAQAIVVALFAALQFVGVSFDQVNDAVLNTSAAAVTYGLAIAVVLGVPWLAKKRVVTKEDLGLQRLPAWLDFLWAPAGAVVYIILSTIIMAIAMVALPFVDPTEQQDTGFSQIAGSFEYILAFISLVIVAPVAEEVLFRGYLFGKLRKHASAWVAILVTSLLFAFVHFQWNVALDVFALSIILCLLRIVSGSLWAPILLHMIKNGVAFYFLFINPSLLSTLGG